MELRTYKDLVKSRRQVNNTNQPSPKSEEQIRKASNTAQRCSWCGDDTLYVAYHDEEWGVPVYDDKTLFEFLLLEGAQAGLSWITVLRKREGYKELFSNFDPHKIASYSNKKLEKLLTDKRIVRNRLKVFSARQNAQAFLKIQADHGSFSSYIWNFVKNKAAPNDFDSEKEIQPTTPLSDQISKDLKTRGFNFVGSTIVYAFMQATGMVNDHTTECFRYAECNALRIKDGLGSAS